MHPEKKRVIIEKINDVILNPADPPPPPHIPQRILLVGQVGGFCIAGKQLGEFEEIYNQLLKERGWSEKFSSSHLEHSLNQLLSKLFREGDTSKTEVYLEELISAHDSYMEVNTVYLPINGIILSVDSLRLGQITIVNMGGKAIEDLESQVKSQIIQSSEDETESEQTFNTWRIDTIPMLMGKTVAIYTALAEPTKVQELAETEWRQVVDLLRYLIFIGYRKLWNISIGLQGDVRYGLREAVIIPASGTEFSNHQTSKSPLPLRIDQAMVEAMSEEGIFALAELHHPGKKTAFSDTLLQGVHWVANALTQEEPANEYLSLVSCLETFLTRERADLGSITNAVAGGVGWVLEEKDFAKRIALSEKIKEYYRKRSTISHGGRGDAIEKDLTALRILISKFIRKMIERRDEFKESGKMGLHEWIDQGPIRRI